MSRFLIQNIRPRKFVTIFGRVLRAARPSLKQEAGQIWVTEAQIADPKVISLIRLRRVKVVRTEGEGSEEFLASLLNPEVRDEPEVAAPAAPEPVPVEVAASPAPAEAPVAEEPAPEPDEEASPEIPDFASMNYRKLQALARSEQISASGKREHLINRLQAHYKGNL